MVEILIGNFWPLSNILRLFLLNLERPRNTSLLFANTMARKTLGARENAKLRKRVGKVFKKIRECFFRLSMANAEQDR